MHLQLTAKYLAERCDLDRAKAALGLEEVRRHRNRAIYRIASDRYAVVYAFGVIAFLGTTPEEEHRMVDALAPALVGAIANGWSDTFAVEVNPKLRSEEVAFDRVRIRRITVDDIDVICRVLAQSVATSEYDITVDQMVGEFQEIFGGLRTSGRLRVRPRALLRSIGAHHEIIRAIISDLALLNAPQLTWKDAKLEALWLELRDHFDLVDRFERLEFKLSFLRESTEQLLEVIQARRAEFLELIIIALFVIDLVVLGIELFV